jgi:type IV secretory pathway VirB2 component (pilin)
MSPDTVKGAAREAGDHPALEMAARVGYAVSGLLHLLIGWLALQVAWSNSGKSADQSGALASLAGNGPGQVALWVAVLGFFGLALWQVAEAIGGYFGEGMDAWAGRGKAIAKAVVYLVLGWTTLSFARGKQSSSKQQTVDFTASMLHSTAGRVLVVVIGLVIVGVGVYHVYKGATKRFLRDLAENPGTFATRAGQIGYIAKGIALAIVGLLFVVAGVTRRARTAGGLDTALHTLRDQPMGPVLLTVVAIGLVAYGIYSFARARNARV